MSLRHTLMLNFEVSKNVSDTVRLWLYFFVNGSSDMPLPPPSHQYFQISSEFTPLPVEYRKFKDGQFHSCYWENIHTSGISIFLPSVKNDNHYWHTILFVDWLCGFSASDGCIGMFQQDGSLSEVCLLFAVNGKLQMYFGEDKKELNASRAVT